MKVFFSLVALLISMSLLLFFVIGCEGPEGPAGPQGEPGPNLLQITGTIHLPSFSNPNTDARIEISNSPSIPEVKLNDVILDYFGGMPHRYIGDNLPISHGDTAFLEVEFIKIDGDTGIAQGTLALPSAFEILKPEPEGTSTPGNLKCSINKGDSIYIVWSSSLNSDEYYMNFQFAIYYQDSFDNQIIFRYDTSAYMQDTCILFPTTTLFPDTCDIDSLMDGYGDASIVAVSGPKNVGDTSNITGDGTGFLFSYTYCDYLHFDVQPDTAGQ